MGARRQGALAPQLPRAARSLEVPVLGRHFPSVSGHTQISQTHNFFRVCRFCLKAQKTPRNLAKTLMFEKSADRRIMRRLKDVVQ